MTAVETLQAIHSHATDDLVKVTSPENGFLGSALEENFGCTFGRDAAISSIFALRTLEKNPKDHKLQLHVKNSLRTLANSQGKFFDSWRDEEPGKTVHELREENNVPSNMNKLAELKARSWPVEDGLRYYGSIDSTPLFVVGATEYILRTGDLDLFEELDGNIRLAVDWMRYYGDKDRDLFIEFSAQNRNAILNQGWMDSGDSIKYPDGTRPKEPIALVEVQGYQYLALKNAAKLYKSKDPEYSTELDSRAETLKIFFNRDFWMPKEGYYASALDGGKKQVVDIRSNVGHLLMTGIMDEENEVLVVKRIMQPDMFTPYGIRTLSSESPNFSDEAPSGYHNGSIWPHDNAIIYIGLLEAGYSENAEQIKDAVLEAEKALGDEYGEYDMELYMVDKYDTLKPYETAQHPQGWVVNANLLWTTELKKRTL